MRTLLNINTDKPAILDEQGDEVVFTITCDDGEVYPGNSGEGVLRMAVYLMSVGMGFTVDKGTKA